MYKHLQIELIFFISFSFFIFRFHLKFLNRPSSLRLQVQRVRTIFIQGTNLDKIQLNN